MGEGKVNGGTWGHAAVEEQGRGFTGLGGTLLLMDASLEAPVLPRGALSSLLGGDFGPLPSCVALVTVVVSGLGYGL